MSSPVCSVVIANNINELTLSPNDFIPSEEAKCSSNMQNTMQNQREKEALGDSFCTSKVVRKDASVSLSVCTSESTSSRPSSSSSHRTHVTHSVLTSQAPSRGAPACSNRLLSTAYLTASLINPDPRRGYTSFGIRIRLSCRNSYSRTIRTRYTDKGKTMHLLNYLNSYKLPELNRELISQGQSPRAGHIVAFADGLRGAIEMERRGLLNGEGCWHAIQSWYWTNILNQESLPQHMQPTVHNLVRTTEQNQSDVRMPHHEQAQQVANQLIALREQSKTTPNDNSQISRRVITEVSDVGLTPLKLGDVVRDYLNARQDELSKRSITSVKTATNNFIKYGATLECLTDKRRIKVIQESMLSDGKQPNSINLYTRQISALCTWLDETYSPSDLGLSVPVLSKGNIPMISMKKVTDEHKAKVNQKEIAQLELIEMNDLDYAGHPQNVVNRLQDRKDKVLFSLMASTGARVNEIAQLTAADVQCDPQREGVLWLSINDNDGKDVKTKAAIRTVPVTKESCPWVSLSDILEHFSDKPNGDTGLAERLRRKGYSGIEGISNHSYRHRFIGRAKMLGLDSAVRDSIAGHQEVGSVGDIYYGKMARHSEGMKERQIELVNGVNAVNG